MLERAEALPALQALASKNTNPEVQRGIAALARLGGVVWYKLDSATVEGQAALNNAHAGIERARTNLLSAARLCPTWLQTMVLARAGIPPSESEQEAYVEFLRGLARDRVAVQGIHLYGLARPSFQPEAPELSALPAEWMQRFGARVESVGFPVKLSV